MEGKVDQIKFIDVRPLGEIVYLMLQLAELKWGFSSLVGWLEHGPKDGLQ